jgi:hypothetical protein
MRPDAKSALDARAGDLARRVAESLASNGTSALAAVLAMHARDPACYEASVRRQRNGTLTAGRMMIEQASRQVLEAIAQALGVALPAFTSEWLGTSRHEGVPLIAGWDVRGGGGERCVKLYVNASDLSRAARARLCAELAPCELGGEEPPAVIGMNARADGDIERKLYVQSADALELAERVGARARALAAAARAERADAGGVLSYDAGDGVLRARAFFVALREPAEGRQWRCVISLPGHDARVIDRLLPFAAAPPRSVGISLADDAWTLYCKPRHSGRAPEALEPVAIFRNDEAEVGVFVEPTEHAERAFRRTDRHAVSVRVRAGAPTPQTLESLVDWFTARLRAAECDAVGRPTHLADPPAPWRVVEAAQWGAPT